jgi:hypothetical protein
MAKIEIIIQVEDTPGGTAAVLSKAWVYWRSGGSTTVLRTDETGRLFTVRSGADRTRPWEYIGVFTAETSSQVDLYFSRGAKPIPDARLAENPTVFYTRKVPDKPAAGSMTAPVALNQTNSIAPKPAGVIVIPNYRILLTKPTELSLWPLLWELHNETYFTDGLSQGAALIGAGGVPTLVENGPAPAAAAAERPKERGLAVEGSIDARATGLRIRILDAAGNAVQLRQNAAATAGVLEVPGALKPAAGGLKPFTAIVYLLNTPPVLGPVQIFVLSDGVTPPLIEAFAVQLVGLQAALVNDADANPNGTAAGAVSGAALEKIMVDFEDSPQSTANALAAEGRARRMISYQMYNRDRALSATVATLVLKPEMPLWMGEFHALGLNRARLEDLMIRRKRQLATAPKTIKLNLPWRITTSWDGPDSGTGSPRLYRYSQIFSGAQEITFTLNPNDQLDNVNAQGEVEKAVTPVPAAMTFPVTGRRLPKLFITGKQRAWGRLAGAAAVDAALIEWQPQIADSAGAEILRGGDGILQVDSIQVDGARIDGGMLVTAGGPAPPPAADPDLRLPVFRILGLNPPSPADAVIDALVEEYFNRNNGLARVTLLTLACWQETIRRILAHEAGHQFEHRGSHRSRYAGQYYGLEQDMPIFGPPHGYGYGQHDDPPVTSDGAWSFFENIKESVRRVMADKATGAYSMVNAHMPAAVDQRTRAVYQREIVRRYNGGTEFQWNGTDWEISPGLQQWAEPADHSKGASDRLVYPNQVLGTGVVYSNGVGAATTFPWPIAFPAAQYGPGT